MRVLLLLAMSMSLLSAETRQERGKRLIDEAIAALGGDAFLQMKDRVEDGRAYSFYRDELSGLSRAKIYTQYITPGKEGELAVRERQSFGKDEYSSVLFNREGGWEITFRGARPLRDEQIERYRESTRNNIFYIFRTRLKEPGMMFDSRGTEVWENQPVENIDITDSENRVVTLSIHHSTKLAVRQVFYRRDPKTRERIEEVTIYSKYRDVGGVQWPYTIQRIRNGEKVYSMFSDSVTINQNLPDTLFILPSDIERLPPKR